MERVKGGEQSGGPGGSYHGILIEIVYLFTRALTCVALASRADRRAMMAQVDSFFDVWYRAKKLRAKDSRLDTVDWNESASRSWRSKSDGPD